MQSVPEILKKIRKLELRTRRFVETAFAGQYHSVFKGRGMNFDEFRQYDFGDEVRSIDWNVTARMGEPYVRKYIEERELTVMLLIDVSASGSYGSVNASKRELAAEVACLLAFCAIRNNDKVGLILFTDRVELYIAPRKGTAPYPEADPRNSLLRTARKKNGSEAAAGFSESRNHQASGGVSGFGFSCRELRKALDHLQPAA